MKIRSPGSAKRCVILQPTFLPWAGFFDLIDQSDIFVILDDVQFSKQSWQQRNQVRGPSGLSMLSVPVKTAGKGPQAINNVELADTQSIVKILRTIKSYYARAPHIKFYFPEFERIVLESAKTGKISELNISIIIWMMHVLGLNKTTIRSSTLLARASRGEYVAEICKEVGATEYISPVGAEDYLNEDRTYFEKNLISVKLQNYEHPKYKQCFTPFIPYASVLDLIFNTGPNALSTLRNGRRPSRNLGQTNTSRATKIAIRVDSSVEIGSGHVMRSLTLANQLRKAGSEVYFIVRQMPETMIDLISNSLNYSIVQMPERTNTIFAPVENNSPFHASWLGCSWTTDAEDTLQAIHSVGGVDVLVVDHYGIDARWEKFLHQCVRLLCVIDDLADRPHDCDVLLDQDYFNEPTLRYKGLIPSHAVAFLGPAYALLRDEFYIAAQQIRPRTEIRHVLVFYGASDIHNLTTLTLKALSDPSYKNITIDVIIGSTNPHSSSIETMAAEMPHVRLHKQVNNMADFMSHADLSFGACGTTTWERCLLGLPAIVTVLAANQKEPSEQLAQLGVVTNIGNVHDVTVDKIQLAFDYLLKNPKTLYSMSQKSRKLMTKSSDKFSDYLTGILPFKTNKYILRPASKSDEENLLSWRNQPDVRAWSRSQDLITPQQHSNWLSEILTSRHQYLFIGFREDYPVGVVRLDERFDCGEISIYLTPLGHGKSNGTGLLSTLESWVIQHMRHIRKLTALVLDENIRSHSLFQKNGFVFNSGIYEKRIS